MTPIIIAIQVSHQNLTLTLVLNQLIQIRKTIKVRKILKNKITKIIKQKLIAMKKLIKEKI